MIDHSYNVISIQQFIDTVDVDPGPAVQFLYADTTVNQASFYISKVDSAGNFIWANHYDTISRSFIYDVDIDNNNNIIVTGIFYDSIDMDFGPGVYWMHAKVTSNAAPYSTFIAKYTPAGNFIWAKSLAGTSSSNNIINLRTRGLSIDHQNNILIVGNFRDTVDFDPGVSVYNLIGATGIPTANYNRFILKLDEQGNFVWVRDWGGAAPMNSSIWASHKEIAVDNSNNILLELSFKDSIDTDPLSGTNMVYGNGGRDICLLKLSPIGTLVWSNKIGGTNDDWCLGLVTSTNNNIYYACNSYSSFIDMDPGPNQNFINWPANSEGRALLKLDSAGNYLWSIKVPDPFITRDIAPDTNDGIYMLNGVLNSLWGSTTIDLNPGLGVYNMNTLGTYTVALQAFDSLGSFKWGGLINATDYIHSLPS